MARWVVAAGMRCSIGLFDFLGPFTTWMADSFRSSAEHRHDCGDEKQLEVG